MATLEFKPPQTTPEPEPELNLLMPQGSEPGLWKSLSQNFQDTFFPKKQPPLVLTSKPVPVKDIWGFYDHKKSGAALSTVAHIIVISLILDRHLLPRKDRSAKAEGDGRSDGAVVGYADHEAFAQRSRWRRRWWRS